MQRLFSTFADGWPGFGLLIQRLLIGVALLYAGIMQLETRTTGLIIPELTGAVLGLFILTGLWTPVVGAIVAAVEVWVVFSGPADAWIPVILAILGGTLAMIGPGAWSIDARLFGRKHIAS